MQDLWQTHYQNLLIILLNEFVKLNINMDMIKENVRRSGLNKKIVSVALNIKKLKLT